MLVVDYNVNIRCPEAGLGREILEKSRGKYSDRARRRGFEQRLDNFQIVLIRGAIRDWIASYSLMEESFPSVFSFSTCSSRKHTHVSGPLPKLQGVRPFSIGMLAKSLTHSRGLVIVAFTQGKPLPPHKPRGAMAQAIPHSFGLIIGTYYFGDGKGVSFQEEAP